jgi:hypothetical protein
VEESDNPSVMELVAAKATVEVIVQATQPPWGLPYFFEELIKDASLAQFVNTS